MRKIILLTMLGLSISTYSQIDLTATGGTTSANYSSLEDAFDAINAGTHTGEIEIEVSGNTFETGTAELVAPGGATSYTSILITPTTTSKIEGNIPGGALINLNGAANVTIDGGENKELTISNNSNGESSTIQFINGASNNVIKNVNIRGASGYYSTGVVKFSTSLAATGNNNNVVTECDITNVEFEITYAVYNEGTAGKENTDNVISNNKIYNFSKTGILDNNYSDGFTIKGNEIYFTQPNIGSIQGIKVIGSDIYDMVIEGNYIHDLSVTSASQITGIHVENIAPGSSILVANNMISLGDSFSENNKSTLSGIRDLLSSNCLGKFYFNTILIYGDTTSNSTSSYAFNRAGTYGGNTDLKNNILINLRTGVPGSIEHYHAVLRNNGTTGTFTSDYNNLFNSGGPVNYIALDAASGTTLPYVTFAEWQIAAGQANPPRDMNSQNHEPVFVSNTDLHLVTSDQNNQVFDNWGTPIAEITTDFDGETRDSNTPDVGADEFAYTLSSNEVFSNKLLVYPNPFYNELNISDIKDMASISIIDISGKVVKTMQPDHQINLSELNKGVYVLAIKMKDGTGKTVKVLKR